MKVLIFGLTFRGVSSDKLVTFRDTLVVMLKLQSCDGKVLLFLYFKHTVFKTHSEVTTEPKMLYDLPIHNMLAQKVQIQIVVPLLKSKKKNNDFVVINHAIHVQLNVQTPLWRF